jgi:hypothetical protein
VLEGNINAIKRNTNVLIDARKDVGIAVNNKNKVHVAVPSQECRAKS